jgi:hypothetical protein
MVLEQALNAGAGITVNMAWTHYVNGKDEMAKESTRIGTMGEV